jgi:hypothetical protein
MSKPNLTQSTLVVAIRVIAIVIVTTKFYTTLIIIQYHLKQCLSPIFSTWGYFSNSNFYNALKVIIFFVLKPLCNIEFFLKPPTMKMLFKSPSTSVGSLKIINLFHVMYLASLQIVVVLGTS